MEVVEMYDKVFEFYGEKIYTEEYVDSLREANMRKDSSETIYNFIPQKGFQENVLINEADVLIVGGNRGGGKAQPYDAKVLTPFGFKDMGSLKVDDILINPDGTQQLLLQIHEQGRQNVYEFEFADGSLVECTRDHLWLVYHTDEYEVPGELYTAGHIIDTFTYVENHPTSSRRYLQFYTPICKKSVYSYDKSRKWKSLNAKNKIVGVRKSGRKKCRCITVSNPNRLYITNNFVVTHNSFSLLMSPFYNYDNKQFVCHGFRKEEDDIKRGLWKACKEMYSDLATFTEGTFTATFPTGMKMTFEHLQDEKQVDRRFRGVEIPHMIIDELTQISYKTFFTLLASNRNTIGVKNQFIGSCNPVSKKHWLYKLLRWYIDEETNEIIHERSGQVRYFFKYGSDISDIAFGDTKEEVYLKSKDHIDALFDEKLADAGVSKYDLISSLCFIEGAYHQNKLFIKNDPLYLGRLAQQGGKQSFKDIKGIWGGEEDGESLLTTEDIEAYISNTEQRDGTITAVADVALTRDGFTVGVFDGDHLVDIEVFSNVGSITAAKVVKNFLDRHHVAEERFAFDADGVGQYLKEVFPKALAFNNNSASSDNQIWYNKKAECAEKWIRKVKEGKCSISKHLLKKKITNRTLEEELFHQKNAMVRKMTGNGKFQLISKAEMKALLGAKQSPDLLDMLFMREALNLNKPKIRKNLWMLG